MTMVGGVVEYTAPGQQFLFTELLQASNQRSECLSQTTKMEMIGPSNQKKEVLDRARFELTEDDIADNQ